LDLSHLPPAERAVANFDHPDALDWSLLKNHIHALRAGQPIQVPIYDFSTHSRTGAHVELNPGPYVIVEGILALHDAMVRELLDLSVFVETPDGECFSRRIRRDQHERGRTRESVEYQYEATVRPMAEQYVLPTKRWADVVVSGLMPITEAVEALLEKIQSAGKASAASPNL
jgi:uridine kinase